jgi:p-cumate 2,3-dioxygenase beta subunit
VSRVAPEATEPSLLSRWALRLAVEDFLYHEADLLDRWMLDDWLALWTEEVTYLVPSTDRPDGDPLKDLFFVQDGRFILEQRVRSMMTGSAWAESPHSTTRRIISNVRATRVDEGAVEAKANFVVHRSQRATLQTFPGHADYLLEVGGDAGFRIRMKRATLDLEELRPHGRVAIIL